VIAILLLLAALQPEQWEYRRRLRVQNPGVLHVVRLDAAALRHARPGLPDLRVAAEGQPLPFSLETLSGAVRDREWKPQMIDRVRTSAGELQFTLRLSQPEKHSRVRIETNDREFRRRVKIETSPGDGKWDVAVADAYFIDFTANGSRLRSLAVDYPASTRPLVRVTVADWPNPASLSAAYLTDRQQTAAILTATAEITPKWKTDGPDSVAEWDFGAQPPPWDRLRLEVAPGSFYRAVEIHTSDDQKDWRLTASGVVSRTGAGEALTVHSNGQRSRHVRIRVMNRDDQPLAISRVVFETPATILKFIPKMEGEHALWYGNPKAAAAAYDLAIVLDRDAPLERIVLLPGPEKRFDDFSGPELPWTEQHPNLFYLILTLIAGAIAVWAVRSIKKLSGGKLG